MTSLWSVALIFALVLPYFTLSAPQCVKTKGCDKCLMRGCVWCIGSQSEGKCVDAAVDCAPFTPTSVCCRGPTQCGTCAEVSSQCGFCESTKSCDWIAGPAQCSASLNTTCPVVVTCKSPQPSPAFKCVKKKWVAIAADITDSTTMTGSVVAGTLIVSNSLSVSLESLLTVESELSLRRGSSLEVASRGVAPSLIVDGDFRMSATSSLTIVTAYRPPGANADLDDDDDDDDDGDENDLGSTSTGNNGNGNGSGNNGNGNNGNANGNANGKNKPKKRTGLTTPSASTYDSGIPLRDSKGNALTLSAPINITGCVNFSGHLVYNLDAEVVDDIEIPLAHYSCHTSEFASITATSRYPSPDCVPIISVKYGPKLATLFFQFRDSSGNYMCIETQKLPSWAFVLIGILAAITICAMIFAIYVIHRSSKRLVFKSSLNIAGKEAQDGKDSLSDSDSDSDIDTYSSVEEVEDQETTTS